MKTFSMFARTLMGVAVMGVSSVAMGNLLADPGFESPLTFDGPPFVGSWEGFNSGAGTFGDSTMSMPRSGASSVELVIDGTANAFAGMFQDVVVNAGDAVEWSAWVKDDLGTNGVGIEMRMEFRDSVNDVEISRTANFTPATLGSTYELLSISDIVPAGADTVRATFAIQSFGGANDQTIFVDDASFTVVPEPATAALLGLGGLAMLRRRK